MLRLRLSDMGANSASRLSFCRLQEKKRPVFLVATANDVSQLPPEMLRKGRFDELWFVDLPNQSEKEAIWGIQIAKYHRNPKDYDTIQLARATEGLTGSEIESVFADSLYPAYDSDREPADLDVARILTDFVPLSKLIGGADYRVEELGERAGAVGHFD